MTGARDRRRAEVSADLLAAAKEQLATSGAAGLSVRAVARAMGMAPSALFRYIAGRDELLTLLIIDAYDNLGDTVEAAEAEVDRQDLAGRWRAIAHAFRCWSISHPNEYALLYGSPVPGFHARADETNRAGNRVTNLLIEIGRLANPAPAPTEASASVTKFLAGAGIEGMTANQLSAGATAWTSLIGAVSAELFEQLGPDLPYEDTVFATVLALGAELLVGPSDSTRQPE